MNSTNASSSVHQTSPFTVPSTQNTAPVLEYRCLYTHDLRRKQKRWQDGLLRFHTFNKRIMVYDVSRNYIGDMHWREDGILQDGDEFELDRGVLIQVGEATGSMEQDLTGLLEKRKKAPEVAVNEEVPHQPVAVPIARPTAVQPSQLRPKTLNALLGTPRGRLGRAALPTKSPHELCMESENSSWGQDRPAKRQRVELQLEKMVESNKMPPPRAPPIFRVPDEEINRTRVEADIDKQSQARRAPTTVQHSGLSQASNAVSRPPVAPILRSRNDEEDKASKRVVEPLPKRRYCGSGSLERKRTSAKDTQVSPKAKKVAEHVDHEPETGYARLSNVVTKPIEIASDEDTTSINQQPKQRSKLLMASHKPRKKLMYRDLLPQESSAISRSSSDASVLDTSSPNRTMSSRPDRRRKDTMTDFHKEEQERLKARLNRHRAKQVQQNNEREDFCGDASEDLFISQEDNDAASANIHRIDEKNPKVRGANSTMTGSLRPRTDPVSLSDRRSISPDASPRVIPRPASTVHRTAMALAKIDEIMSSHPQSRIAESVKNHAVSTEVFPQELSSPPFPETPLEVISTTSPPKDRPHSSPAFQTQAHVPYSKDIPQEANGTLSRPDLPSSFTKAVQPKAQESKQRNPNISPSDPYLPFTSPTPVNTVPATSPPRDRPLPYAALQIQPNVHPTKPPTPEPTTADDIPPIPNAKSNSLLTFSKIVAPKSPPAPEPTPRHKPTNQPTLTKVIPVIPTPEPLDETVDVPSSQPPTSPPPEALPIEASHPPKRKPDSLPAFTKVVPTKPRSPLKKAASDTSAMRARPGLSVFYEKENTLFENPGEKEETASLWSKEAWDLFGCGRDGVECTYEEFKRKEGLM
ncbi:hypothetical protein IMSHALPRED_006331 [Imshaugia aleurites]|uniref:5'-3' DNA helicase ZGRF1-like N-terminal domain-containing protein n=1 Tax=Imshaugia aleurites TaxID=172621 RepID=A0A8H3IRQ0_9LECA|nr:hypothetical protein IMSHALPRED_006331 [Imshaugia aleurites]